MQHLQLIHLRATRQARLMTQAGGMWPPCHYQQKPENGQAYQTGAYYFSFGNNVNRIQANDLK